MFRLPPSSPRFRGGEAVVAEGLAALSLVMALAAVLLLTRAGAWGVAAAGDAPVDAAVAVTYSVMGALVIRHGEGSRAVGRVLLVAGVASGITVLTAAVASVAEAATLPVRLAAQAADTFWVPGFLPLLSLLPLVFPSGLLPGRIWRAAAAAGAGGVLLLTVGVALYPEPVRGRLPLEKVLVAGPVSTLVVPVAAVVLAMSALGGLVGLVLRVRRSTGLVRRQVAVLLAAAVLLGADVALQPVLPPPAGTLSEAGTAALVPVAIGFAVTRHGLYDFDLAVRRTLAGVSLVACLAGLYLAAFAVLDAVLGRHAVAGGLAAGLTGLVVLPLGTRLVRGVDRLFYGDRADRFRVVSGFAATLGERLDIAEVPQAVCGAIVSALRLSSATLVVEGGRRAAAGEPHGPVTEVVLRHRGRPVGTLAVTPRLGERALDERDAVLIRTLADSAAAAVAALGLTDSLQEAREALVAAREEERRRVRRDLHDGVGAALAGLRLQLDSARELVSDELAGKLLDSAGDGLAEAVRDLRLVTDDLRPPVLDDLGLAAGLEALAGRVRHPGLAVELTAAPLSELPAAVDVACYRIAAEALANAARHAGADRVELDVRMSGGNLCLTVSDNGRGLSERPSAGLGLSSMRRRAEEIGGSFALDTGAAGTRVRAVLPLRAS